MNNGINASVGAAGANRAQDVKDIQQQLNQVPAANGGPTPKLKVDGICGPKTLAAVRSFQSFAKTASDGRIDPGGPTEKALKHFPKQGASQPTGASAETPLGTLYPNVPVSTSVFHGSFPGFAKYPFGKPPEPMYFTAASPSSENPAVKAYNDAFNELYESVKQNNPQKWLQYFGTPGNDGITETMLLNADRALLIQAAEAERKAAPFLKGQSLSQYTLKEKSQAVFNDFGDWADAQVMRTELQANHITFNTTNYLQRISRNIGTGNSRRGK